MVGIHWKFEFLEVYSWQSLQFKPNENGHHLADYGKRDQHRSSKTRFLQHSKVCREHEDGQCREPLSATNFIALPFARRVLTKKLWAHRSNASSFSIHLTRSSPGIFSRTGEVTTSFLIGILLQRFQCGKTSSLIIRCFAWISTYRLTRPTRTVVCGQFVGQN